MRTIFALSLLLLAFAVQLSSCTREDGLPDPPPQMLVPADDAGSD